MDLDHKTINDKSYMSNKIDNNVELYLKDIKGRIKDIEFCIAELTRYCNRSNIEENNPLMKWVVQIINRLKDIRRILSYYHSSYNAYHEFNMLLGKYVVPLYTMTSKALNNMPEKYYQGSYYEFLTKVNKSLFVLWKGYHNCK